MDTAALQNIGLTDGEIRVYLALLKLGSSTSGPITDKSKVASSKIYNILERLMQKGIVSYIIKEKTRYYQAEDPIKIKEYVNNKEIELMKQKEEIDKLIPDLQLARQLEKTKNEVQIYKGFKGIQTITDHIYLKLVKGDTWYNVGVPSYQEEKYHSYWHDDHIRRIKHGIKCKMLFKPKTPKATLKNRNHYKDCVARYMPISVETPSWILIYKDVTVIILPGEEPISVEITNRQIADSFKQYFDAFWNLSKIFG
jgi:HTH-type transcriptional regulator, sugar sensing transcriptional regulator